MWQNPQFPVDLVTFTSEILNEKLHFLFSEGAKLQKWSFSPSSDGNNLLEFGDECVVKRNIFRLPISREIRRENFGFLTFLGVIERDQ